MHICFWAYKEMMLFQNSQTSVCQKLQHKNIKANASHTNAQISSRVTLLNL
jgi:hypothetical protein